MVIAARRGRAQGVPSRPISPAVVHRGGGGYPGSVRLRLSPVPAVALVCAAALIAPASSLAAASPSATASAAKAAPKKKKSTSARVTALSRSLNRAKAQQRSAQKQLDALVKQQLLIGDQVSAATTKVTDSLKLSSPEGVLGLLQDPSSGIPQLLAKVTDDATKGIRQLLASGEYAVAVVTVGNIVASPTLLVSADIPDIGAPITFSGKVPVIVPTGVNNEAVDVRVGAVSLEGDGNGDKDPAFMANLNHFSVRPAGFTGDIGDAILKGGASGVNLTQTLNGNAFQCTAGAQGCGAPVWSGPNPAFNFLPFWPVGEKLISFGDKPGVEFDLDKMLAIGSGGRLASVSGSSTGPIVVSTNAPRTGVAMLEAELSITVMDASVAPGDPLA